MEMRQKVKSILQHKYLYFNHNGLELKGLVMRTLNYDIFLHMFARHGETMLEQIVIKLSHAVNGLRRSKSSSSVCCHHN